MTIYLRKRCWIRLDTFAKVRRSLIKALCAAFNEETQDGRNMSKYSELLGDSIASIIEVKDENDMDSFLSGKQMSFLSETINGLDDFELISFLVIK